MSVQTKVAAADAMIPETAPFSPEQRAWLNGFFSGLLSLDAKAGATNGIESVRKNAPLDERFERKTSKADEPYFVLKADNGEVIGVSEMYSSKSAMENGIESVKKNAPKDAKEEMLPPGPNGPVGIAWLDLTKEHYGIHGTPEPQTLGRAESSGCVRMSNWDVARLSRMVKPGVTAIFQA